MNYSALSKGLALFDFDGTITYSDSFVYFLFYAVGRIKTVLAAIVLSPILCGYCLGLVSNHRAKQKLFSLLFSKWSKDVFLQKAEAFSRKFLPSLVSKSALDRIHWHKVRGHRVVVVSASLEPYLAEWCRQNSLELICTRVEFSKTRVTGRFATSNCYGSEKVNRIKKFLCLDDYDRIYAYGDSRGDREMLALADEAYYRKLS